MLLELGDKNSMKWAFGGCDGKRRGSFTFERVFDVIMVVVEGRRGE